jgi:DNA-binding IclR family transcriptional regulator
MSTQRQSAVDEKEIPAYRVPALERGLDVLELLARRGLPMTQAEIARALGRGPSELFRTLTALDRRGYLQRDPVSGAYRLTLRLFELGRRHRPHDGLIRAAERPMRALMEETGESCHLSVLHRGELVVLAQEEGPARVRISVAVGSTIAPRHAASGRVLLTALDDAERAAVLDSDAEWNALDSKARAAELARLASIRERGYEVAHGETVAGVSDISTLVGTPHTSVRAALAIAALPREHDAWVETTLPLLLRHAAAITETAGLAEWSAVKAAGGA